MYIRPIAFAAIATILLGACEDSTAQKRFESEARKPPSGITRTDATGRILSTDPDDWRISPYFLGFVEVQTPAFPNPTTNQRVTIDLFVTGMEAVNGIQAYARNSVGEAVLLYEALDPTIPIGLTQIFINPTDFSRIGRYQDAIGLHRVFIYDRRGNLMTYGDIQVE
jgi:hypothetical protein